MKHLLLPSLVLGAITGLQAQTASLHGRVRDESGAVVPGATVSLTSDQTAPKSSAADGLGAYSFSNLPPGNY